MSWPDIGELIPHSGAMALLDRVLAADAESLCAEVAIGSGSMFAEGGAVGAWIGIEYMAQAVAAHAGYCARLRGEPVRLGFLLGSRRYQCSRPDFAVGRVLRVLVRRELQGDNGLGAFACRIEDGSDGSLLASAVVTVYQPADADEFLHRHAASDAAG